MNTHAHTRRNQKSLATAAEAAFILRPAQIMRTLVLTLAAFSCVLLGHCAPADTSVSPETATTTISASTESATLTSNTTNPSLVSTNTFSPTVIESNQLRHHEQAVSSRHEQHSQIGSQAATEQVATSARAAQGVSHNVPQSITTTPSSTPALPLIIRSQSASGGELITATVTTPTTTQATTIETKVPSRTTQAQQQQPQQPRSSQQQAAVQSTTTQTQKLASQQLAQQQTTTTASAATQSAPTATTNQFQFVRPQSISPAGAKLSTATAAAASLTTTSTAATPTITRATGPVTTIATITSEPEQVMCQHNSRTFSPGQRWNDDCIQTCECVLGPDPAFPSRLIGISACKPRCPVYQDPPGDKCKLLKRNPEDCCLEWQCELDAKYAPSVQSNDYSSVNDASRAPPPTTTMTPVMQSTTLMTTTNSQRLATETVTTTTSAPMTTTTAAAVTITTGGQKRSSVAATTATAATNSATTMALIATSPTQRPSSSSSQQAIINEARSQQQTPPTSVGQTATVNHLSPGNRREPKQVIPQATPRPNQTRNQSSGLAEMIRSNQFNNDPLLVSQPVDTTAPVESRAPAEVQVDPMETDLCIWTQELAWRLGDSWQISPCNQSCRCAFRNESKNPLRDVYTYPTENLRPGSFKTEIRCGLPAHCDQRHLLPSAECPGKQLKFSVDSCVCPEVVCSLLPSTQKQSTPIMAIPTSSSSTTTTTITTTETPPISVEEQQQQQQQHQGGCRTASGKTLAIGDSYNDECHSTCRCTSNGEIRCEPLICKPPSDHLCIEWAPATADILKDIYTSDANNNNSNKCCPGFVCKKPVPVVSTDTTSDPTLGLTGTSPSDEPIGSAATTAGRLETDMKSCMLLGNEVAHGKEVPEIIQPRGDTIGEDGELCERTCVCDDGKIVCQPNCPSLTDEAPSDLDCPASMTVQLTVGCCRKWTCQLTEPYELKAFKATPVNSSTLEVDIALPDFALDQRGRIELNYTSVPPTSVAHFQDDEPPAEAVWFSRSKIRTHDGLFSKRLIVHYLSDLKPGHKYWLKALVRFEGGPFSAPIESPLQSIVMPQLVRQQPAVTPTESDPQTKLTTSIMGQSQTSQRPSTQQTQSATSPVETSRPVTATATTTTTTTTTSTPRLQQQQQQPMVPLTLVPRVSTSTTQRPSTTSTTTRAPASSSTSTTTTTASAATSTTSTTRTPQVIPSNIRLEGHPTNITKPGVDQSPDEGPECKNATDCSAPANRNGIDSASRAAEPVFDQIGYINGRLQNAPIERYAWHLLAALSVMTVLFVIVSYLYCKKSRVIAPITSPHYPHHHAGHHGHHHQSAYDNPTFTKLLSYYQPHVLLVDENNQNFDNLAKQKNMEVDKSSPLNNNHANNNNIITGQANHRHITTPVHHNQNGRQHLI